ncbi:FadR family transcriptional regulator [Marinilongibacter aquaticus]|uniref:FadR/GntR family transcriptional regulator n=1 Tax=Marinilongibacter aquaticus TaxID=2975157 RepID=UPI0021BD8952|nr:FadR/GntR family transcriptional regulator [Marinilongibacter aquaticus]UBM58673.1 FadR family transcriptional regulator [Marinilongibacter aquaticus]
MSELTATTLADRAEERIIHYIRENKLVPGDAMPNESQFSEMMGISRNVVREAISRLKMLGLVQSRTKRGMVVTEPPLLNGFKKVLDPNLLSIKTIKEMMGMRIALEIGIAGFLFANINADDIVELEQIVSRQEALGINNLSVEDEMRFHTKIYEVAGNDFILQMNKIMYPVFEFSKRNYESYFLPINKKLSQSGEIIQHADLLELIKNGDKEAYQKAIQKHLEPYWEFLYNY